MTYKQYCNSTKQHNKTQNIVITYKMELIRNNITQYNVLYHIVKYYHTKYDTLQYFALKYNFNILQNTILFPITPYHDILQKNTTSYIDQSTFLYFKLDFSSSLYMPHAMETQRSNISSGHWYLLREVSPLMIALLSQGSYRAVPTRPFHGEILCDSNALEGIRTSDHSERVETNYQLS